MEMSSKALLLGLGVFVATLAITATEDVNPTAAVELRQVLQNLQGSISPEIEDVINKWQENFQSTTNLAEENVQLKAQIVRLQDSADTHKQHEESMERTMNALNAQIASLQKRMEEYEEELQHSEKGSVDSDLIAVSLKNNNTALKNELSELKKRYEILHNKVDLVEAEKKEDEEDLQIAINQKEQLQKKVIIQNAEIEKLKKKLKDANLKISSLQLTNANLEMEQSKNAKKMVEIKTSVEIQSENQLKLQADLSAKNAEINNLDALAATLKQENQDLYNKTTELEKYLQKSQVDAQKAEKDKYYLMQQNSQLQETTLKCKDNGDKLTSENDKLKAAETELKTHLKEAARYKKSCIETITTLNIQAEKAVEKISNSTAFTKTLEDEIKSLQNFINQLQTKLNAKKDENDNVKNAVNQVNNKLTIAYDDNDKLKQIITDLQRQIAEVELDLKNKNLNANTCFDENNRLKDKILEIIKQKNETEKSLEIRFNKMKCQDTDEIDQLKQEKEQVHNKLAKLQKKYELVDQKNTDLSTILTEVTELTITKEMESFDQPINLLEIIANIENIHKQLKYVEAKLPSKETTPEDVKEIMQKLITTKKSIIESVGNVADIDLEKEKQYYKAEIEKVEQWLKSEQTKLLTEAKNTNSNALKAQLKDLTKKSREKTNSLWRSYYEKERCLESLTLIEALYERCNQIQSNDYCLNVHTTNTGVSTYEDQVFPTSELLDILKYNCENYLRRYNENLAHLIHKINNAQLPEPYEGLFGILDNGKQDKYKQFSAVWGAYKERVKKAFEPAKRLTPLDGQSFRNWVQKISEDGNDTTFYIITTTTEWIDDENGVKTYTVRPAEVEDGAKSGSSTFDIRKALQEVLDINNHEVQAEEVADQIVRSSNALVSKFWVDADALTGKEEEEISNRERGNILVRLAKVDVMVKYLEPYFDGVENKFDSVFAQIKEEADNSYGQAHTPRPVIQLALH